MLGGLGGVRDAVSWVESAGEMAQAKTQLPGWMQGFPGARSMEDLAGSRGQTLVGTLQGPTLGHGRLSAC